MTGNAILTIIEENGPQTEDQLASRLMAPLADVRNALSHLIFDEGRATCKIGVYPDGSRRPAIFAEAPSAAFITATAAA